jgi:hypothetical protein
MNGSLVLAEGEREVMRSSAKLLERQVTSHLSASTGGLSVRPISGLTLRLGGWSGDRTAVEHELAPVDAGDLVKTDRRLVFLGEKREIEVDLSKLVGWHLEHQILRVYSKGHDAPYVLHVDAWSDSLASWADPAADPMATIDSSQVSGWIQPGFPKRILLDDQEVVVDADPLLPFAAAFLDTWPAGRRLDAQDLARGVGISFGRAQAMMPELEALGFTSRPDAGGEASVFDPDGLTIPRVTRDESTLEQ